MHLRHDDDDNDNDDEVTTNYFLSLSMTSEDQKISPHSTAAAERDERTNERTKGEG